MPTDEITDLLTKAYLDEFETVMNDTRVTTATVCTLIARRIGDQVRTDVQ
ncbi:hypothetical protein [Natrarchaeobaculum sulfurireducens]|nr:hypothetical protein [Natrarchaeobaculum sulfurireducens]